MNVVMIGTGYVGLISGLCFAEFGFNVTCVDKNEDSLNQLSNEVMPIYEPGLKELFHKHYNLTKRIKLSKDIKLSISNADVVFITVGTPGRRISDDADLKQVFSVADEIADSIKKYCLVVVKSTVPVGTSRKIKDIIGKKIDKELYNIASNPEFLREGNAIDDFMRPDRVVIGIESKKSEEILKSLYRPLYINETPIVITDIETAEIIKYASNSFLATKITFINEVANLCEKVGANIQDVSKAMGLDKRIGSKFLHAGPGYGGSCFPKDVKSFSSTGEDHSAPLTIVNAVRLSNENRPTLMVKKICKYFSDDVKNINFCLLGLSFKPNTDDIRESTSIIIGNKLLDMGAKITAYDPLSMPKTKEKNSNFNFSQNAYDACDQVDAVILATEWNEFRALDIIKLKTIVKKPVMFDLRNIYDPSEMIDAGWEYISIGR